MKTKVQKSAKGHEALNCVAIVERAYMMTGAAHIQLNERASFLPDVVSSSYRTFPFSSKSMMHNALTTAIDQFFTPHFSQ